jgi:hypothetical protein
MPRIAPIFLTAVLAIALILGLAPAQGGLDGIPDYLSWQRLNPQKNLRPSAHPIAKDIYVDAVGAEAALTRTFPMPEGSILVKESTDPATLSVVVISAMRKVAGFDAANGDWQYAMFERLADGSFGGGWSDAGSDMHQMCSSCHARAAERDYLFLNYTGQ